MSKVIPLLILIFAIFFIQFLRLQNSTKNYTKSLIELFLHISFNLLIAFNIVSLFSRVVSIFTEVAIVILYLLLEFILYFLQKKHNLDNSFTSLPHNTLYAIMILSIVNIILTLCAYGFIEYLKQHISYILIFDLYFLFSNLIAIHICNTLNLKQEIDNLKLYNKTVLTLYDDTRAFKHDMNNIIQAFGGYIENNNFEGLQKYYKDILKDYKELNNLAKLNPELINNPAIYNILANKYFIANNHNIEINLEILLDLNQLNIKYYDFSRVLGILLDNAIEASKECDIKNINISFKKDPSKQMLIIENTYNDNQISIDKIFDKNFTTKPHNTGLGLWEVRKILKKYSNLNLHTSKTDSYFSQQLEIYNTG